MDSFFLYTIEGSTSTKFHNIAVVQNKGQTVSIDSLSIGSSVSFKSIQNRDELSKETKNHKEIGIENAKIERGWNDFTRLEKFKYTLFSTFKIIVFIILLYLFLLSLSFLSIGFTLISPYALKGSQMAHFLLKNPFGSLAIGILATAIMQNATATTSIVVIMVGVNIIPSETAVPIIMGSNFGTCLTNIFIALTVSNDPYEFKRAFSAAVINDFFNLLTTAVLLPLEIFFNFLSFLSQELTEFIPDNADNFKDINFVAAILDPVVELFIRLDHHQINNINLGSNTTQIALRCCSNENFINGSNVSEICNECDYWCMPMLKLLGDGSTGLFWIIISLAVHLACLFGIVKVFGHLLEGPISDGIRNILNGSLPGKFKVFNNFLLFAFSFAFTLIVQSLDIVTATLVPLCGIGIVSLNRAFVMTLGSNLGTTVTGILSALTQTGPNLKKSLEIAFVYTFFNLFGTLLWLPIPSIQYPKILATKFGNLIFKFEWLTYVYSVLAYFIIPAFVFGLALVPNWIGLAFLLIPIVNFTSFYFILKIFRKFLPHKLPEKLQNFSWLTKWITSLEYWDSRIKKVKLRYFKDKIDSASQYSTENERNSPLCEKIKKEFPKTSPNMIRKISTIETIIKEF